jgi:hypothetical protein
MTRTSLAAVAVLSMTLGAVGPALASRQEAPSLSGQWTLNRQLSQLPREVGFDADWIASPGSGGDPPAGATGQRPGGAPSGGNRTSFPISRVSREDSMRNALLTTEAREPAATLAIVETATDVTLTPETGPARTFHPTGKDEVLQLGDVTVVTNSTREPGRLIVRYKVNDRHELRYTYSRVASPPQLAVAVQFLDRGKGNTITRIYEPEPQATPPVPAPPPPTSVPAAGTRGAAQDFDRRPDAQFTGLNRLGVVVEGLGAQATACGLSRDAIESATVKQLTDAGLKVAVNADEDTYVYVNVITATTGNGMCISRYDAFLYSHTTAALSHHPAPVLVDVSLMRKGGLAAGGAAAHAESVMRGLQEYVGQITARIRDANK